MIFNYLIAMIIAYAAHYLLLTFITMIHDIVEGFTYKDDIEFKPLTFQEYKEFWNESN